MNFNKNNGCLYYKDTVILSNLENSIGISEDNIQENGCFLKFSKNQNFTFTRWQGITIESLNKFTALYRKKAWWFWPHFGIKESQIPQGSVIIWFQRHDGLIVVLVPLIHKGYNCYVNGTENGIELIADNNCLKGNSKEIIGLYVGVGTDFYGVTETSAKAVISFVNVGLLRKDKALPKWVDYLGYCTWNTFYKRINQEKVLRMIHHIVHEKKVNLGFFLLDDGWQWIKRFALYDKGVYKRKFPDGFKKFTDIIKKKYHIQDILVWHTLQGYWGGITRKGPYGKRFSAKSVQFRRAPSNPKAPHFWMGKLENLEHRLYPISRYLKLPIGICLPNEMNKLLDDYYQWLASQGITGVKVDNQSGTEFVTYNLGYQANLMRKYHETLEKNVSKHFSKCSIINCMSMNTNIFYQLVESNITRNSDDYFPKNIASQTEHIIENAYNNLWTGFYSLPDWDMFQSNHDWGDYQAASRVISGSPVYFADDFRNINPIVLKKIVLPNGKLLRCRDPSLICRDMVFRNPAKPNRGLKLFNHNKYNSVLGIFNVMQSKTTTVKYSIGDIEGLDSTAEYAVYRTESKVLITLRYNEQEELHLNVKEFEIFTVSQIKNGFAPIGMLDKYNPGGIFDQFTQNAQEITFKVKFGGEFGFYSEKKPQKIQCEGKEIEFKIDPTNHFLRFLTELTENQSIQIKF